MANKVLLTEMDDVPPQISFAAYGQDFSPAAAGDDLRKGADVEVQMDLDGVADSEYRESDKADLGANRAPSYRVMAALEWSTAPTAGEAVYLYWGASSSATAGTGNPAALTGADADYTGEGGTDADATIKQCALIGVFVCTNNIAVQLADCGVFSPTERYGVLVLRNESGQALDADGINHLVVLNPIVPEVQ